ncbi:MAG TPA: AroM family protein [Thermomicrobiaceae bacterium]|nr:AroM family protein [Thermomicrobiaceae bacterium]
MNRIGLITIGQGPRDDVVASMFDARPPAGLLQAGALDLLDDDAIGRLGPRPGDDPLVTRLGDGREVEIAEGRIVEHLQGALDRVVDAGAGIVVVLCTGEFPELRSRVPIIFPDRLLRGTVDALLPAGVLGVLMPHRGQGSLMSRKWATATRSIACAVASPYTESSVLAMRARELASRDVDLIVMDCMGYDRRMKSAVAAAVGLPTMLANRLVGRIVEEIAER